METPLHSALSRGGQHAAISMLLEHGADIAAEDSVSVVIVRCQHFCRWKQHVLLG